MIDSKIKEYIEKKVLPLYMKNDEAHSIDHIDYVIKRSIGFASTVQNINFNMVYTIAAYHDCGHHIDAKTHELVSARILYNDKNLSSFFSEEEMLIMKEAIEDHRASSNREPRSIYGKIVSSADRNTLIDVILTRTYNYIKNHHPNLSLDEMIEESMNHIKDKFGKGGYAIDKMYFPDNDYYQFLEDVVKLLSNKEEFKKRYIKVNKLFDSNEKVNNQNFN